jgi:hypothetical protein
MSIIRLPPLSPSDAEIAVALLWQILERDGIASPRVRTETLNDGFVQLSFTFRTLADAAAVGTELPHFGSVESAQSNTESVPPQLADVALRREIECSGHGG